MNQPIGTVGEDDWLAEMIVNMMMVFAAAERTMIRSRVQESIDTAIADGKRATTVRLYCRGRLSPAVPLGVRARTDRHPRGA